MPTITPTPPGVAVGFADSIPARFAAASPGNLFTVGTFQRGTVAQVAAVGDLTTLFGPRQNNSVAYDAVVASLAEGGTTQTISTVTGPSAVAATLTLGTSVTVTAKSPGEWGNALSVEVVGTTTEVGLIVTENSVPVATSPRVGSTTELAAWTDDNPVVDVTAVSATLPEVAAAKPLVGGAGDLANIGPDDYTTALDRLDRRYGPGILIAPGVTDLDAHIAIGEHLAATNRVAFLDLDLDSTEEDAFTHEQALQDALGDDAWRVGLWASWAYCRLIGGEPSRLVPYSAVQAGVASRVYGQLGVGRAPFGHQRGVGRSVDRLARDFTTASNPPGEVQRLYAQRINTAVDRGTSIAAEGYRTLDPDAVREDLHGATVRMDLGWRGEALALNLLGEPVDKSTLASYAGALNGLCDEFVVDRAFNADADAGYRVDVEGVNTPETMARREIHGALRYRPTGSTHWADLLVGAARPNETI